MAATTGFIRRAVGLCVLAQLQLFSGAARAQLANAPWPMYQRDAHHDGRSAVIGPQRANLKWQFFAGGPFRSAPVVGADGSIYAGVNRAVYVLNPDGSLKQKIVANSAIGYSSPTLAQNGWFYVGERDNGLHAFDQTGTERWVYLVRRDGDVHVAPAIASDGTIYMAGAGQVNALYPDGTLRWAWDSRGTVGDSSPAIGADGTVYLGTVLGYLHALTPDGAEKWTVKAGSHSRHSSPAIGAGGTIYLGTSAGVTAVDPQGNIVWQFAAPGGVRSTVAVAADGTIYFGSLGSRGGGGGTMFAVSSSGQEVWRYETDSASRGGVVIGGDSTIYATAGPDVLAFRPAGGTPIWQYSTARKIQSAMALGGDGTLYVASGDANLYALGQ